MNTAAKTKVWLAAMNALHSVKYGQKLLVASDVADALGLKCLTADGGFELVRFHNKNNPCSRFTRIAFFKE